MSKDNIVKIMDTDIFIKPKITEEKKVRDF